MTDLFSTISKIVAARNISQRSICEVVGFNSSNQLTRILQNQVSSSLLADFARRLYAHADVLELSEDERYALSACLADYSPEQSLADTAQRLFRVLCGDTRATSNEEIILTSIANGSTITLRQYYERAASLHLTMLGCHEHTFFENLALIAKHTPLSVDFYYREGASPDDAVAMLEAIFHFQHESWFHPHCIRSGKRDNISGLLNADVIFADAVFTQDHAQDHRCDMIIPNSSGSAQLFPLPHPHIEIEKILLTPTAQTYSLEVEETKNYLDYLRYIQTLEHNHSVFRIKPDIGLEMIPAEIQVAAFMENPASAALSSPELIEQLTAIQSARFKNSHGKKQRQVHIFSYEAMERFAKTGVLSDHFWGFRPLTPLERLHILEDLYAHSLNNANFFCLFLKKDVHIVPDEIIWYDDAGISFLLPNTHYQLNAQHSELFLRDPGFAHFFSGYFRKYMCGNFAYSQGESSKMLLKLIDLVKMS